MESKDWRSVGGNKTTAEGHSAPALPTAHDVRHAVPGTRTADGFFAKDKLLKSLTRQDYVNLRSSEEFARGEGRWWRRIWRFLIGDPQVVDTTRRMAEAHARSLARIESVLTAQQNAATEARRESH